MDHKEHTEWMIVGGFILGIGLGFVTGNFLWGIGGGFLGLGLDFILRGFRS